MPKFPVYCKLGNLAGWKGTQNAETQEQAYDLVRTRIIKEFGIVPFEFAPIPPWEQTEIDKAKLEIQQVFKTLSDTELQILMRELKKSQSNIDEILGFQIEESVD